MNKTIKLDYPVSHGGTEHKEFTMRRPKVRDLKTAQKQGTSDADHETLMFANLCEVTADVIDEMDMADYAKLQEVYQDFLSPPGKKSGK